MAPTNSKKKSTSGLGLWWDNAREAFTGSYNDAGDKHYKGIRHLVSEFPGNLAKAKKSDKIIFAAFTVLSATVIGGAWAAIGAGAAAIQALGFAASGFGLINQRLELNQNKLAIQPIVSGAMALQQALLGGFGYAVMAGIAGARSGIFSMIPDDPKYGRLRTGIALCFASAGIVGITAISLATGLLGNLLTIPSMLMGTIADRIPSSKDPQKDHSRWARFLRCVANTNNAAFNAIISGSWAGLFSDTLAAANNRSTIRDYDVPVQDRDGTPLSRTESLQRYMQSMLNSQPANGLTPNQIKDAEEAVQNQTDITATATITPAPAPQPTMDHKLSELSATSAFKPTAAGETSTTPAPAECPVTPPAPGPAPG